MNIIAKSLILAHEAHRYDTRMDRVTPYIVHPLRVMTILHEVLGRHDDIFLAVALVHDVEEDHGDLYPLKTIAARTSSEVAEIAHHLCKPPVPDSVSKAEHNVNCYLQLAREGGEVAHAVKIADRLDNLSDPQRWPTRFRLRYIEDTQNLINAMRDVPQIQMVEKRLQDIIDGKP